MSEGLKTQSILLTEGDGELAKRHNMPEVIYQPLAHKDGYVSNQPVNRHLIGNIVLFHRKNTTKGSITYYDFVPIDNVLVQNDQIDDSINAEADRIAGHWTDDGHFVPGELDLLHQDRMRLGNWRDLLDEDKTDINDNFGQMAKGRGRAINPLNRAVGLRAERAHELANNPQAVMATTHPMERDLEKRFIEVVQKNLKVNNDRAVRLKDWIFQENRLLAAADETLDHLIKGERGYDKYTLVNTTKHLRFRLQPFNMLAHAIRQTGDNIEDPAILEQTKEGLQFHSLSNYLLLPFRKITSVSRMGLDTDFHRFQDSQLQAVDERLETLESLGMSQGPYHRLIGRLLLAGEGVKGAFHSSDAKTAYKSAEQFKWLMNYLCLPKDDPELDVWYKYKLQ